MLIRRAALAIQQVLLAIAARASANAVQCINDPSLPQIPEGKRYFIASNLHNNEKLLPHFTLQLLGLLQQLPKGSTYVSIYESGSTDRTGVLDFMLAASLLTYTQACGRLHGSTFAILMRSSCCAIFLEPLGMYDASCFCSAHTSTG